jgi:primase-polymerase (primpol)-like protein
MMYQNIPAELRSLAQWVNWRYETREGQDKPTKIPLNPVDGKQASVINPLTWNTFDRAVASVPLCNGIGFVFTKSDPFCGVDIDGQNETDPSRRTRRVEDSFHCVTYGELSPSNKGLHYIVRATLLGSGRRRNGIEVYDNSRFFTFTGKKVNDCPITDQQAIIDDLYASLGQPRQLDVTDFSSQPELLTDYEVYSRAAAAYNGSKFTDLWSGHWQLHYSNASQSEADLALVNILAFYTRNTNQLARLFRLSALGQRDKAKRKDYVEKWLIRKAMDRQRIDKLDLDRLYNYHLAALAKLGR